MAIFGKQNTADAKIRVNYDGKQAERGLNSLKNTVGNVKNGIGQFAKALGPAALAVGGLTLGVMKMRQGLQFVREASQGFESSMSRVKAISGATSKEFAALSKRAQELGESTVFSASQVADAFTEMAKLGLKTNEIIASSEGVLNLAALAQVDMATAAQTTVSTLNQFQLTADSSNGIVDLMAKSFTSSALDITKFSEAMKVAGPIAANTGVEIQDMAAALAVLADNSIDASLAGTAMRKIMLTLSDSTSKASKRVSEINPQAQTLSEKMRALAESGMSATEATELFDIRATTAAQVIAKNIDALDEFSQSFRNADGAAKQMADTMLDNVEGATKLLESAQEGLGIAIGEAFADSKKERILLFAEAIQEATKFVRENRAALEFLGRQITDFADGSQRVAKMVANAIQWLFRGAASEITQIVADSIKSLEDLLTGVLSAAEALNNKMDKLVPDALLDGLRSATQSVRVWGDATQETASDLNDEATRDLKQIGDAFWGISRSVDAASNSLNEIKSKGVGDEGGGGGGDGSSVSEEPRSFDEIMQDIRAERNAEENALNEKEKRYQEHVARLEKLNKELRDQQDENIKKAKEERDAKIGYMQDFALGFGQTMVMIAEASNANNEQKKTAATVDALINTGVSITKTAAELGYPLAIPFIAMAAAQGAAQVAMIQKQEYEMGGLVGSKSRRRQQDSINAVLGDGEYVMPAPQTARNFEELEAIRNNTAEIARGSLGGTRVYNFNGLSTEQVIQIQKDNERRSVTGNLI